MIKKLGLQIIFIFLSLIIFADTPGKRSMSDSKIILKNTANFKDYIFYWKLENDSALVLNADTALTIPGSGGRPLSAMIWAVNKSTNANTDTLFLDNYYSPDYTIRIDTVYGNKLLYTRDKISNGNSLGDGLTYDAENRSDRTSKISILVGTSLIALIFLIWYFIKRKAKEKNTYGTGS